MRYSLLVSLALTTGCANHARRSIDLYEHGDYAGAARAADEGLAEHPGDDALWAMRVRAALALGDGDGLVKMYGEYTKQRGEDDRALDKDLAIATIEQALGSPSAKLKVRAIEAVADMELQALADDVAKQMESDDDRVAAAAAIAVLRGYPQAPELAYQLLKSDQAEVRRTVIDGIGKKIGKLALPDIERGAADPDAHVRAAALRWLGQLKDPDAVAICTKMLHDKHENVRAAAAEALAKIGLGDLPALGKQALADKALAVRLAGVDLYEAAHRDDLLAPLAEDADPMVALAAALAVKPARSDLAAKAIERAAADEDPSRRAGAANYAVRALGKPGALALAGKLTGDADLTVRLAAARVLAHGGDPAGAATVLAAALDGDHAVQAAADLAEQGDARGLDALSRLAHDPAVPADTRAQAVAAHRDAHHITPGLVAALADGNAVVRIEAAATLGALAK